MMTIVWALVAAATLGWTFSKKMGFAVAVVVAAVALLFGSALDVNSLLWWLVVLAGTVLLLLSISSLRQRFITAPAFAAIKKAQPKMSQTEREALDAGTVWWEGDYFKGTLNWDAWHASAPAKLSDEEHAFLDGPVEQLCALIDDWQVTHNEHDLSHEAWAFIKKERFFGMIIPKQYGGLGYSELAHSEVVTKISTRSISAAVTVMVPNSLGPGELLLHYGTEAQKDYYLPRLASGDEIPCFALTSPEAGSDAAAIPDTAVVCQQINESGETVLGLSITWNKRYITLAPVATVLGLAFHVEDPEQLIGEKRELGMTCALIPTATEGVKIGQRHFPLNATFMNGPTQGENVFIPMDWVIGGQDNLGKGWRMLMESLSVGRCISLPSLSCGGAQLAARSTGAYARVRQQFNTPIGAFEGVQEALAQIGGHAYQMNAARKVTISALHQGEKPAVLSAILKYHLTERLRSVVNHAMDVQGGSGICMGPKNLFARPYQTIPIAITVEGANILTRSLIIFGQGAVRAHPYLYQEMQAVQSDSDSAKSEFDGLLVQHIQHVLCNAARSLGMGLSAGYFVTAPKSRCARYYQKLEQQTAAFALIADMSLLTLGGGLKRKERISARLGDSLSQLYLATTALKQYHDDGEPEADMPLVEWAAQQALYNGQQALAEVCDNLPMSWLGVVLKRWVFPIGRRLRKPCDQQDAAVAELLLEPSKTRDRLTSSVYIGEDGQVALLEKTLDAVLDAAPVEKKIRKKTGKRAMTYAASLLLADEALNDSVINEQEAAVLRLSAQLKFESIQVDDFESLSPQGAK